MVMITGAIAVLKLSTRPMRPPGRTGLVTGMPARPIRIRDCRAAGMTIGSLALAPDFLLLLLSLSRSSALLPPTFRRCPL